MSQSFYRAFEDRYRGSRAEIGARLAAYAPFLRPLAALAAPARALDLGCGRGEWLELLAEHGLAGHGVDLDAGMLEACRERGLDVELGDALACLRAQPAASLALVSAFHLVEHLPFELMQELIAEARRVLLPGGLLILETPNPENLTVGATSFYLDPTHQRPLPPALLDFAVGFAGFARRRVLRLQEDPALHGDVPLGLLHVLEGVSPDYAVVAQQEAPAAVLAPFAAPFAADYGLGLAALALRYEARQEQERARLHHGLAAQGGRLDALDAGLAAQGGRLDALDAGLAGLAGLAAEAARRDTQRQADHAQLAAHLAAQLAAHGEQLARAAAQLAAHGEQLARMAAREGQLEQRIADLLGSSSWRLTAPLRWLAAPLQRGRAAARQGRLRQALRRRAGAALMAAVRAVLRAPRLKRAARAVLAHFPHWRARLQTLAYRATAPAPAPSAAAADDAAALSPRARHALQQLQRALDARKH